MEIKSDEDLEQAVSEASDLLQSINSYLVKTGRNYSDFDDAKVRFPRGYIRTAGYQRKRLVFVKDQNLKTNLAYTLILSDTILWLLIRTDLWGIPREMLQKLYLFLMGSLVESITKDYLKGSCAQGYKPRTKYLLDQGTISQELKDDLDWLWDVRNKMHLFQLDEIEYNNDYNHTSHFRAIFAFRALIDVLKGDKENDSNFIF